MIQTLTGEGRQTFSESYPEKLIHARAQNGTQTFLRTPKRPKCARVVHKKVHKRGHAAGARVRRDLAVHQRPPAAAFAALRCDADTISTTLACAFRFFAEIACA